MDIKPQTVRAPDRKNTKAGDAFMEIRQVQLHMRGDKLDGNRQARITGRVACRMVQ